MKIAFKSCKKKAASECFVDTEISNAKSNCRSKCGFMLLWIILWLDVFKDKLIVGTFKMARMLTAMIVLLWKY